MILREFSRNKIIRTFWVREINGTDNFSQKKGTLSGGTQRGPCSNPKINYGKWTAFWHATILWLRIRSSHQEDYYSCRDELGDQAWALFRSQKVKSLGRLTNTLVVFLYVERTHCFCKTEQQYCLGT